MKICIFGAASNLIDKKYIDKAFELSKKLAERGHDLVFGAGDNGMMGASARGFKAGGGKVYGFIPEFFKEDTVEPVFEDCDEIVYTQTMSERKQGMEDMADAFIIVPGGIGTLEEMFEVITLKQLAQHKKPIAFYNVFEYYTKLLDYLVFCEKESFIREGCHNLYIATDDDDKLIEYLEDDTPFALGVKDLK